MADVPPVLAVAPHVVIFVGPAFDLSPHRIAMTTNALALEEQFEIALPFGEPEAKHAYAMIPAGTLHHLRATGPMAFIYCEAPGQFTPSEAGLAQARLIARRIARVALDPEALAANANGLCAAMCIARPPPLPARLQEVMAAVSCTPGDFATARDAAALAGLSTQTFQRSIKRETGQSFGHHLMRARLLAVLRAMASGIDLTSAAHDAGFSSSAHLSATVRRLFGLTPSLLARHSLRYVAVNAAQIGASGPAELR